MTRKSSEWESCEQRRMAGLVPADRITMVTQITTVYSCGEEKSIWEHTDDGLMVEADGVPVRNMLFLTTKLIQILIYLMNTSFAKY